MAHTCWQYTGREASAADFAQIQLVNLATREAKTLTNDGYDARLTVAGDLVFGRSGRVFVAQVRRRAAGGR